VKSFLRKFSRIGINFIESYGATEVGAIFWNEMIPNDVLFKLEDVEEMNFFTTDLPYPRGELLVKTKTQFSGYFKDKKNSSSSLNEDGWYYTGDIVQQIGERKIQIIGRKKEFFKLSFGEFITPTKIEFKLQESKYISQIFVHGDSTHNYLIALIYPNLENIKNINYDEYKDKKMNDLIKNEKIINTILNDISLISSLRKLRSFEIIRSINLIPRPFSIEDGTITASNKLSRNNIIKKYSKLISDLYANASVGIFSYLSIF
jgi:long-subunit acyl-CoA synthetase (AMP-forming)